MLRKIHQQKTEIGELFCISCSLVIVIVPIVVILVIITSTVIVKWGGENGEITKATQQHPSKAARENGFLPLHQQNIAKNKLTWAVNSVLLFLAFKLIWSSKLLLCLVWKAILEQYTICYCVWYLQTFETAIRLLRVTASGISSREYILRKIPCCVICSSPVRFDIEKTKSSKWSDE